MVIPVTENKFLKFTEKYINQILKMGKNLIQKKILLLSKEETFLETKYFDNFLWK